jgi:hypothetical protein
LLRNNASATSNVKEEEYWNQKSAMTGDSLTMDEDNDKNEQDDDDDDWSKDFFGLLPGKIRHCDFDYDDDPAVGRAMEKALLMAELIQDNAEYRKVLTDLIGHDRVPAAEELRTYVMKKYPLGFDEIAAAADNDGDISNNSYDNIYDIGFAIWSWISLVFVVCGVRGMFRDRDGTTSTMPSTKNKKSDDDNKKLFKAPGKQQHHNHLRGKKQTKL